MNDSIYLRTVLLFYFTAHCVFIYISCGPKPWYLYKMVTSEHFAPHMKKNNILSEQKIQFLTALDLIKCLKQIK